MQTTKCPDQAACQHRCDTYYEGACWRVSYAGPEKGLYSNDDWPDRIVRMHVLPEDREEQEEYE